MSTGRTALAAVQAAIMGKLAASTALAELGCGAWDVLPDQAPFPYVVLESAEETIDDTLAAQGRAVVLTFAIFSTYAGRAEQLAILDTLVAELRYEPLALAGWAHGMTDYVGATVVSPFALGNQLAGSTLARFSVLVTEA